METFFRNDHEVQEWVDLFIEKLLTISLLSGNDADSEFYQGRQAIDKIASMFKEMVELPEETLKDGIRQLVEQRLPDPRVIENFPHFYELMNEMIVSAIPDPMSVAALADSSPKPKADQNPPPLPEEGTNLPRSSTIVINRGGGTPTFSQDIATPISLPRRLLDQPEPHNAPDNAVPARSREISNASEVSKPAKVSALTDNSAKPINVITAKPITEIINTVKANTTKDSDTNTNSDKNIDTVIEIDSDPGTDISIENSADISTDTAGLSNLYTPEKQSDQPEIPVSSDIPNILEVPVTAKASEALSISKLSEDPGISEPVVAVPASSVAPIPKTPENKSSREATLQQRNPFRFNPNKAKAKQDAAGPTNTAPVSMPAETPVEIPRQAERLNLVLKGIFPSAKINWHKTINNQTFLAQIEKLLIYLPKDNGHTEIEKIRQISERMKKEGWKIYICQQEDLNYPRRLEREIRSIMR